MKLLFIAVVLLTLTHIRQAGVNGTWIPIKQELGGRELPPAAFAGQKLTLQDSNYIVNAESTDKGIATYNGNKLDITGREGPNAGKHFKAIYKLEDSLLTVCYDLAGKNYPPAFATKGQPLYFLSVFKRE